MILKENKCTPVEEFEMATTRKLYHAFSWENGKLEFNAKAFLDMVDRVIPQDSAARSMLENTGRREGEREEGGREGRSRTSEGTSIHLIK